MFSKRILISAITILLMSLAMDPAIAVGADPNTGASNYVETARLIVPDMGPYRRCIGCHGIGWPASVRTRTRHNIL